MSRLLVSGGTVVSPSGQVAADVLVDDQRIVAVVEPGSALVAGWQADVTVDAAGKLVVPGGIDAHTHMEMPFGGTEAADSFETGTIAAAWGGTTTIVDFAVQPKGGTLDEAFHKWMEKATGKSVIDFGFHLILSDVNESTLKEMDTMVGEGVTSFKMFMAYPGVFYSDDGQILAAMQQAAGNGATIQMHAENGIAIDRLVAQALARGHTDPRFHGTTRPPALEGEATHRAIVLAQVAGAPLYIVHLSAAEALAEVTAARDAGLAVWAETCPQYLYLTDADMAREGFEGAKYVCSPPVRAAEHGEALWAGLRRGDLSVVATDHCPFCYKEQKELGVGDFSKIPNGLPGVEHRMDLLYQGVAAGRIPVERWVELTSTAPARLFGLFPRKGLIAPGSDADLVVYDPNRAQVLSAERHHMAVDYSAYEGFSVTGAVDTVISRGEVVLAGGSFLGTPGRGRFLARGPNLDAAGRV